MGVIINGTFIFCSFFIAFFSIRKWLGEKINHEFIFNWGMSFFLVGIGFILNMFFESGAIPSKPFGFVSHILDTLAFWFQLSAVMYLSVPCDNCHRCRVCKRKKIRLFTWILLVAIFTAVPLIYNYDTDIIETFLGLQGLQLTGLYHLDLFFEGLHVCMAIVIGAYFIPIPSSYLDTAFLTLAVSEAFQFANIYLFSYAHTTLFQLEWFTAMISILLMFYSTFEVVVRKNRKERYKNV